MEQWSRYMKKIQSTGNHQICVWFHVNCSVRPMLLHIYLESHWTWERRGILQLEYLSSKKKKVVQIYIIIWRKVISRRTTQTDLYCLGFFSFSCFWLLFVFFFLCFGFKFNINWRVITLRENENRKESHFLLFRN